MQSIVGYIRSSKGMRNFNRKYNCVALSKSLNVLQYKFEKDEFMFVSLWTEDADIGHAVCIRENYIFDSNCQHALNLSKEMLDVSCNGVFCKIHTGYLFHSCKKERKLVDSRLLMAR